MDFSHDPTSSVHCVEIHHMMAKCTQRASSIGYKFLNTVQLSKLSDLLGDFNC